MRLLCIILLLILMASCRKEGRLPDMTETFGYRETKPFGTSFFYDLSSEVFEGDHEVTNLSIHRLYLANEDSAAMYISVCRTLSLTENDVESLLRFISEGNNALISSEIIDTGLLETFKLTQFRTSLRGGYEQGDEVLEKEFDIKGLPYSFYHRRLSNYFYVSDTSLIQVAGYNSDNRIDAVIIPHGAGKLLLHANPRAFSNYFLLTGDNYLYARNLFQAFSSSSTKWYWDNFYPEQSPAKGGNGSTLSEILRYPSLAAAFFTALLLLILFIIFQGKRRRSIIPVISNAQTPASFMETISELYIHEAENMQIANKIISQFQEHVTRRWYIPSFAELNAEALAAKTGVSVTDTLKLYELMDRIGEGYNLPDEDLVKLEELTQMFYKK